MFKVSPQLSSRSRRRGLLRAEVVVLALAAWLLAALVIPTIAESLARSRRVVAVDRLRQIHTKLGIYHDLYRSLPVAGRPQRSGSRPEPSTARQTAVAPAIVTPAAKSADVHR